MTNSKDITVQNASRSLFKLPKLVLGSMPRDGGNLILTKDEATKLINDSKFDSNIVRKYIGSSEFINGKSRYCLWMNQKLFNDNKVNDFMRNRVEKTRIFRKNAKAKSTQQAALKPWEFVQKGEYEKAYGKRFDDKKITIIIPKVSSKNRLYVPMGIVDSSVIVSDLGLAVYNAPLWLLGLLESRMHMTWLRAVGGRLKTDYRYSAGLVYNTFPVPDFSTRRKNEIEDLVLKILDIRNEEGGTLADLYGSPLAEKNPKPMNDRLLQAHQELDEVIDRAYKTNGFKDDNERLSLLLDMYSKKVEKSNESRR